MVSNNISVENAKIGFRNFAGKEGKFNPEGKRNFCWFIEDLALAKKFQGDGWNVKYLPPREQDEAEKPYLQIAVNYNNIPPKIVLMTSRGKTVLEESEVNMLDWADIKNIDMIIRPYNYDVNGRKGTKAYLKAMYVTIEEDEFELKYADLPDAPDSAASVIEDDDVPF